MMLKSFAKLLRIDSTKIFDLFNEKSYKPLLIQNAFIVNWPEDLEEHLYVSHTSIITKNMVQKSICGCIETTQDSVD